MSVEHILPAILSDGLVGGLRKPDSIVENMLTGGRGSRSFSDYHLETYSGKLISFDATTEELEEFQAFLRHIQMNVDPFYLVEPLVRDHDQVFCGPPANGTETAFILPFVDLVSLYAVTKGGQYVPDANYTLYTASNIVDSDNSANAVESVGSVVNLGGGTSVARQVGMGVSGRTCFKVTQAAAADNGLRIAALPVDGSKTYRFRASVMGTGSFEVEVTENGTGTPTTTTTTPVVGAWGTWSEVFVDKEMLADTTAVEFKVKRTNATALTWFAGALGCHPAAFSKWFLPSVCPGVIDFDSAPDVRSRVICSGRGNVVRRVVFSESDLSWALFTVGHAYAQNFKLTEILER